MTRWIAAAGCALALALVAAPLANRAEADGIPTSPVFTHKRCIAPASWFSRSGARTTWVCRAIEKCCYDWLLRKGTCIPANRRCF